MKKILKRQTINTQLEKIFDYPLTLVVAAMGYGKTTAVKDFLDEAHVKYIWLSVESDETSARYVWDALTRQLAKHESEFGNLLNALGFPVDAPQRDRIINIISDFAYTAKTVLVIDDYHLADSPELDRLFERIARANISGLHLVLISRTKPEMNLEELKLKGYCYLFKSELFELSNEEIKAYFKLFGQEISDALSRQVHQITEGWITAVYLISQRYCEIGSLEPGRSIESLIETAVFSHYKPEEIRLLLSLCILDSFSPKQAVYITEDTAAAKIMQRLSESNSLIRYDERTGIYKIHHILSGYLRKASAERLDGLEIHKLYKRAGEWHIQNGDVLLGLKDFLKAKEYDLILAEFEKAGITKIVHRDPQFIVNLFEQIPLEMKYRHPIGYLNYANFYITNVDMKGGAELLTRIEKYAMDDPAVPSELQRRICGEIEFFRSFLFFNDMEKMHQCHFRAYDLLDGHSVIASKDMIITYGSPHAIYLYYREKGKFRWVAEYLEREFRYYRELAGGCGAGFEELVWAEYYLETGDHANAELYAQKAIYKAEPMGQFAVIVSANFTLARLYLARGKFAEAVELIDYLYVQAAEENSPVLNSAIDLGAGYIGATIGEPRLVAGWLKAGDMEQSRVYYQGMGFNYIVHAKTLLQAGDYLKVEVLCEQMQKVFAKFNNIYGYLHTYIMDAAVRYKLYGMDKARNALEPALEIGRADGIILPFAEYGIYILDILKALQEKSRNDVYLNRLVAETPRYSVNLKRLDIEKPVGGRLTGREREILQLVVQGQTNREIAAGLYIAEITVRKNITSIYRKLEVDGRAAAVKKAVEMKLV